MYLVTSFVVELFYDSMQGRYDIIHIVPAYLTGQGLYRVLTEARRTSGEDIHTYIHTYMHTWRDFETLPIVDIQYGCVQVNRQECRRGDERGWGHAVRAAMRDHYYR